MEWLPDIAQADYGELARAQSVRVAEVVAVYWPEPDGVAYYCTGNDFNTLLENPLIRPLNYRFKANQFLDLPIEDGIADSRIKLDFGDGDAAIAELHHRHGAGVRVAVFYWFPDFSYFIEQWHGHLDEPDEEDGERFVVTASYGYRSILIPLPNRPLYDGCQAIYPLGRLLTQAEINDGDCPWNLHLPGGTMGVFGSESLGDCPRRQRSDCVARLGDSLSYLGFDAVDDTYPNANEISRTRGNNNNRKRPLRVIYGPYVAKDLDLLGFAPDINNDHPDRGWVQCIFAVSEGVVEFITDFKINDQYVNADQWEYRAGTLRQSKTFFSPNVGNYSGTAIVRGRLRGDFRFVNGDDLSGQCRVGRRMNIRQWTDATTYTDGPTYNRAWVLMDAIRNQRWGYGLDSSRFVMSDWITLAAWCDENIETVDANGAAIISKRSTFIGELGDKTAQRHIYEICLAGNFSLPFAHRGNTRIMGLSQVPDLSSAPVFTDAGEGRNIVVNDKGLSMLSTWKVSDRELPNRVVVTFKDKDLDNEERPRIVEDVTQQLRAGKSFGDRTRRRIEKRYDLLGVDELGQADWLRDTLIDLGPLAGTTDEGPGLKNNRLIKFTTWFTHALPLHKYQVIKVVSSRLARYGFEYWRISKITRQADLKVEIECVAHPVDYYETINPVMIAPASLPDGIEGVAYSQSLIGAGGVPPYVWTLTSGSVPTGLSFSAGVISGTPTTPGTYSFEATLTDSGARATTHFYSIVIASAPPPPPPPPPGGGGAASLTLSVHDAARPISLGVPVDEAANLLDTTNLRLKNASGTLVAAALSARIRWRGPASDTGKAVKVLAVDFFPNGTGTYTIESGTGNPAPTAALAVTSNSNDIQMATAALDLKVAKTGLDLMTSFKLSATEQLASGSKPRGVMAIPAKSRLVQNAGVSGSAAANAGQNFVTVETPAAFTVGQQVKFQWTATFTGLGSGVPKTVIFTAEQPIAIGNNEFTPAHKFIFDRLGSTPYVYDTYQNIWNNPPLYFERPVNVAGVPTDTFPSGMAAGVTIEDKEALDAGNYTIQAISGNVITLTGNLTKRLLIGVEIVPVSAASPITVTLEAQSAAIIEQNALRAVVKQTCHFKAGATRVFGDLAVDFFYEAFAGQSAVRVRMLWRNSNQTMPAQVRKVQFNDFKLSLPLGVSVTASSDSVTVHDGTAGSACARRIANTSNSTAVAGSFKFTVAQLAENFPAELVSTTGLIEWKPYPPLSGGASNYSYSDKHKEWQFYVGQNADTLALLTTQIGATLNAAYVCTSNVIRRGLTAPRTWAASDFNGDAVMAEAANRLEKHLQYSYDLSANDSQINLGSVPRMSYFERETSAHTQTGNNNFGAHFGVHLFGQTRDTGDNFTTNRYAPEFWWGLEWVRRGDARAWRLMVEHARYMATGGTIQSALPNQGNQTYNQLGKAVYEKSNDGIVGNDIAKPTHNWDEGLYLYWALTGDVIAYDTLLLRRAAARRFFDTGLAAGFTTGFNEDRAIGWNALDLWNAWRYLGDVADKARAINQLLVLNTLDISQGSRGVYVAPGYESNVYGKQPFNQTSGYVAPALAEVINDLRAEGTPHADLERLAIDAAKWAARGLAQNNAPMGNAPVKPSVVTGADEISAQAIYNWYASGNSATNVQDGVEIASLSALGLLNGARLGHYADLLALAREIFKSVLFHRDNDSRVSRPVTERDKLTFRNPFHFGSMLKIHFKTLFALVPFLADAVKNQSLNPPTITSITPASVAANANVTLTLTGTGFSGSQVGIGGYLFTPSNVAATSITLTISANLFTAGKPAVLVSNANGGQSNLLTLTVT